MTCQKPSAADGLLLHLVAWCGCFAESMKTKQCLIECGMMLLGTDDSLGHGRCRKWSGHQRASSFGFPDSSEMKILRT